MREFEKNLKLFLFLSLFFNFLKAAELKNAEVSFTAVGSPSFLRITGEASKLDYVVATEKGGEKFDVFEFPLKELSTGIDLRDEQMKEKYLDVKEYPTARLKFRQQDQSVFSFSQVSANSSQKYYLLQSESRSDDLKNLSQVMIIGDTHLPSDVNSEEAQFIKNYLRKSISFNLSNWITSGPNN